MSGRGSRLIAAIRALEVMHVDIAILTEAKINDNVYPRSYMGYHIMATTATSINQGGIALAWRERNGFSVESVTINGPNILSFQLVSSGYRWLIVAVYMSPNSNATDICEQLLQLRNKYTNLPIIVTGDFNINLDASTFNQRDQQIFDTLEMIGVNNMIKHFRQRRNFQHGGTWRQFREGNLIRSTCDCVLSDDSRKRFKRVRITNPRHFDSDHYAICFALFSKRPKQHQQYLRQQKTFPLRYKPTNETQADTLIHQFPIRYHQKRQPRYQPTTPVNKHQRQPLPLHNQPLNHPPFQAHQPPHPTQDPTRHQPHDHILPHPNVQPPHQSWVSDYTWRLIDQRASMRRQDNPNDEHSIQHLSQQIRKSLRRDRKRRTTEAGEKNQQLLDENDTLGAWAILRRWYRQVQTKVTKPSLIDMGTIHNTFQQLYKRDTDLPPTNIPVTYTATPVPDHPPNDFEITLAVQKLRLHKAPGPSGLTTEDVLHWMRDPDQTK
jgi:Endonuclease-reverse transcriptase